jgi:glycosyltransferase involved in cell wall biosynthesis
MNKQPCVSVIIPCYNQGKYLGEAIESVLGQNYRDFQIIVVDDGSTDNTAEVAGRYEGVRVVRQANRGLAEARNAGMSASLGEFLVFLDADDRLMSNALEAGVRALKGQPGCAFVYGHVRLIGTDGSLLSVPEQTPIERDHYVELLRQNPIWTLGAVMYRREAVISAGPFNPLINASADYDMNLRLASKFPVRCHGEVILEYRKHDSNMTRNLKVMLKSAVTARRIHRKSVRRNRRHRAALREGTRSVQKYYGEKLVSAVRDQFRDREMKQALSGLIALLKYYPEGLAKHAGRKILRVLRLKNALNSFQKNSTR